MYINSEYYKQTFDILTFTVFMTTITFVLVSRGTQLLVDFPVAIVVYTISCNCQGRDADLWRKTERVLKFFPIKIDVMISNRDHSYRGAVSIAKCNSKEQTTYCIDFGHSHPSGKSVGLSMGMAI